MKKNLQNQRGFTLIETLLGVFVFSLIMVVLGLFARNIWIYSAFISGGIADVDAGRQAMATMSAEIRTANTADTGAYVIDTATSSTFTFYSDIDGDGLKEKVRYFVSGGVLKKGVIKPSGSPLTYNAANEKIYSMIPYLNN
ncbi:MAG TPA: prepilin-type N-terminal cleavage/methylation domain-containing protein, partial [Candidatus Paceibacterota bacterium]|nr:prepilin-type N-terminal cleavage/methylation domain-containing protein [Candidatus Paceibacterota bacterium]